MTTVGPTAPGTVVNTDLGRPDWISPANAKVEDGSLATVTMAAQFSDQLTFSNFAWSLPVGAVISNILIEAKLKTSGPTITFELQDSSHQIVAFPLTASSTTLAWQTLYNGAGGATARANIAANTDSYNIDVTTAVTAVFSVDAIRITLTYSVPPVTKTQTWDSLLAGKVTTTETFDAVLAARALTSQTFDANLGVRTTKTHTFDATLTNRVTTSQTWDANMFLPSGTLQQNWDAVLAGTVVSAQTFDAALGARMLTSHGWDAALAARVNPTHTFDAALSTPVQKTHTWDARMANYTDKTQTWDARLAPQIRVTQSWDVLIGGVSHSHPARTGGARARTDRPRTYDDGAYDEGTYDSPGLSAQTRGARVTFTRTNGGIVS